MDLAIHLSDSNEVKTKVKDRMSLLHEKCNVFFCGPKYFSLRSFPPLRGVEYRALAPAGCNFMASWSTLADHRIATPRCTCFGWMGSFKEKDTEGTKASSALVECST